MALTKEEKMKDKFLKLYQDIDVIKVDLMHVPSGLTRPLCRSVQGVLNRMEQGETSEELLHLGQTLLWTAHQFILKHIDQVYVPEYIEEARKEHEQKLAELERGLSHDSI